PPLVAWQFVKQGNEAFANRRAAEARARAAAARGHDPVAAAGHVPAPGHHDDHGHTAADGHGHGERQPLRPAGAGRYVCAVLACADTDVDLAAAFGLQRRDLLVLRAPGPFVTAEAVALLERAVERHRLSLVVVLAHGDCDALRAPIGHQDALTRRIAALRSRARTPDERLTETLVTRQRQLLLASSRALSGRVEKDELRVVPGLFDDRTGRIEWVARRAHTLPIAPIK
ncbi:MAG: hypothetical protein KAI24_23880, partial [Planctomycetes bacterium]|nr:hypothetical protein [Planctomycetota bacterium]